MDTRKSSVLKRMIFVLAAGMSLSGCAVYAPPYAATPYAGYDATPADSTYYYPYNYGYSPYAYSYPSYYWPPVSLSLGYSYRGGGGWRGYGGGGRGGRGGWRGGRR
jgi:hypothetical protein